MLHATAHVRVRYSETDQMRFVHHGHYIHWFEAARIVMFDDLGHPYAQCEKDGYLLPVLSVSVDYRAPARFDDRLDVHAFIRERPRMRIHVDYRVERQGELLATGKSSHAFMSPEGRPLRPPPFFSQLMDRFWPVENRASE